MDGNKTAHERERQVNLKWHMCDAAMLEVVVLRSLLIMIALAHCCHAGGINGRSSENCSALLNISEPLSESRYRDSQRLLGCPPWFTPGILPGTCKPGPPLDDLTEQDKSLMHTRVMYCHCSFSVGLCLHKCVMRGYSYLPLPCDVSQLQNVSCPSHLNRRGHLCSECTDGYGLPVYSYALNCVICINYQYNWLKYLAVAYGPIAIFYIFAALFSINFTSPTISGVILMFQSFGNPLLLSLFLVFIKSPYLIAVFSFASLWNLDFLRAYFSFCLYPSASAMTITALEFPLALFPFFLIAITYLLVKLHDKRISVVVYCWKLLRMILRPLRREIKTSLVKVFASFIYLSCSRILITSMYFLIPSKVYFYSDIQGVLSSNYCVAFFPSIKYLGKDHILFALLAFSLTTIFFTLPMLLLFLYPFKPFQQLINRAGCNSLALHTFMDVFQGSYKNWKEQVS